MKRAATIFKWAAWAMIAVITLYVLSITILLPSYQQWMLSQKLAGALSGARSVTVFELSPYYSELDTGMLVKHDIVFQRIKVNSTQVEKLRAATSSFAVFEFGNGIAGCFVPHHRVEVVQRDGSMFRFDVCFHCRNFCFNKDNAQPMPSSWIPLLLQFFTDLQMPPKSDGEYQKIAEERVKAAQNAQ